MKELNNKNPLVYIVMPCYNGEKYLLEQLMSIYYQNYTNRYLIFVNDGSTDNSENIIRDWITHYNLHEKVKVITKENGGVNSAVQRWLEEIKNICDIHNTDSLISYCDADDVWTRDKLYTQVGYMIDNQDTWLSYHNLVVIDGNSCFKRKKHLINTLYINDSFSHYSIMWNHVTSTTIMFRPQYINLILPMPLWFWMTQDKWTALTLLVNNIKLSYIDSPLGYYRVSSGNMTTQAGKVPQTQRNQVLVRYIEEIQKKFREKDLSYYINFNKDRRIIWYNKYPSRYIFILESIKYPWTFFDRIKKVSTDFVAKHLLP